MEEDTSVGGVRVHKGNFIRHMPVHGSESSLRKKQQALTMGRRKKIQIIDGQRVEVIIEMDPDFEQLSNDADLVSRIKLFRNATNDIEHTLKLVDNQQLYETLSNADKIKYNLLMSFGMNTLFWMYLRAEGIEPATHQIKTENHRLKQSMTRAQQITDRKTIMPRLNKNVARRFVKSGLWTPGNNDKVREGEAERDAAATSGEPD